MSKYQNLIYLCLSASLLFGCKPSAQTKEDTTESELAEAPVDGNESGGDAKAVPVSVVVSSTHGCARHDDGAVSCWPLPVYERDNTPKLRFMAKGADVTGAPVAGIDDATALVAGDSFVCAKRDDGGVDCWNPAEDAAPANVLKTAEHLDAFGATVCGSADKTIVCAVLGESGWAVDEPIALAKVVVEVEVGGEALCLRYADDTADCRKLAGVQGEPQLEPGMGREGKPVALENVSAIEAGEDYICARISDTYHCWGEGSKGRGDAEHIAVATAKTLIFPGARFNHRDGRQVLRDSIFADQPNRGGYSRQKALPLTTLATNNLLTGFDATKDPTERFSRDSIGFHTDRLCVIGPDDAISCVIEDDDFISPTLGVVQPPMEVQADAVFADVIVSGPVTYALDESGRFWAMGLESQGNKRFPGWWSGLGYNFMKPTNLELSNIESFHSTKKHTFVRTGGSWEHIVRRKTNLPEPMQGAERLFSAAGPLLCSQTKPGSVDCTDAMTWMLTSFEMPGTLVGFATPDRIGSACFLNDAGDVYCDMKCFRPSREPEVCKPQKIELSGVTHMVSGNSSICFAKPAEGAESEGKSELHCGDVKTSDGDGTPRPEFEKLATLDGLKKLESSTGAICAIFGQGQLTCWGRTRVITLQAELVAGDDGMPAPSTPAESIARFADLPPVSGVAMGSTSACALTQEGKLWCWGINASGGTGQIPPYVSSVVLER